MAKKKEIVVKDVTNERPIVELHKSELHQDIEDIKESLRKIAKLLEKLENSVAEFAKSTRGGF